jgi:hypothetical protein
VLAYLGLEVIMEISEFKVMRSAAGWYIGTECLEEYGWVPNSRESGYFETEEEAQRELEFWLEDAE